MSHSPSLVVFDGPTRIALGPLDEVARKVSAYLQARPLAQPLGFDLIVAGRADELGQLGRWKRVERARFHHSGIAEIFDGTFDISPRRVLHEHRTDDDLER